MSILLARGAHGFDPDSDEARWTELALLALEGGTGVPAATRAAMFRGKFANPMLGQRANDRLAPNAYQVPIEGPSYREQQRPGAKASNPPQSRKPRTGR